MNVRRVCMLAAVILCSGSLLIASAADTPKTSPDSVKASLTAGQSNSNPTTATSDSSNVNDVVDGKVAPASTNGTNPTLVDTNQGTQVPWTPATPSHGFAYGARGVGFDGTPGTDAPPAFLGGFPMTPFPTDARPLGTEVTDIPVPSPCSGVIAIDSPTLSFTRNAIGSGWNSWSHGYTGDVYTTYADPGVVTLTMPDNVCAIYFYVEPNTYTPEFDVTCVANLGLATEVSSGPVPVLGDSGATYFGFFASAPDHIETITITVDSAANGWAMGEFGIVCGTDCVVAPVACCFESTATCHDSYDLTQCIAEGGRYDLGVEYCADMDPACGALIGACCAGPDAEVYEPYECIGDMTQVACYALPEEDTNWTYGESCAGATPFDCNAPTYCDVAYSDCGDRTVCESGGSPDDWIMNVTFGEINNTTGSEPCPDSYGDYTDLVAYVAYGVTYTLSVETCGEGSWSECTTAWIDWNGDKTFDEETERYDLGCGTNVTLEMDITVPPTAVAGYTRMRVIENYDAAATDACAGGNYGETEDYMLLISGDIPVGSCCDPYTGICADNVAVTCCPDGHDWSMDSCADRVPACGNPGACCDVTTGECQDGVLELLCEGGRFEAGEDCEELEPPCGTPGACCIDDTATCTIEFEANCEGRFLAGAVCDPDPWEALGQYACGDWTCSGILYAPSNDDEEDFRNAITAACGDTVDYLDTRAATPTLEDLQNYCIVYTWGNGAYADPIAFGDVLADYVDNGGTVILGQWTYHTTQRNWLEGRIMTEAYCPITASSYTADSYVNDSGSDCIFNNVNTLSGDYFDQCDVIAGAQSDGELSGGKLAAAWRADKKVYYLPGSTTYTTGDLAQWIANVRLCNSDATGACCDPTTGTCTDDVAAQDCPGQFALEGECAVDFPNCGDRGACCNPYEGTCEDDVLALDCPADYRHEAGEECEELEPICGTPGACCIDETATCTIEFEANCEGRFLAGAVCDPDPWEALGQAACGDWTCGGILYAPSYDDDETFRSAIAAACGDTVDYLDPRTATPTLEEIQDYCIVYTWVNNAYADPVAYGDVLAQFVDNGGTVILGQWTYNTGQYNWLEGQIMTEAYCPITASSVAADSYVDGSGTDCIFSSFHTFSGDYFDQCDVIAGAQSDGELSGGKLAAAWRADKKVYYIPGATPINTGDLAQLIANVRLCNSDATGACCDPTTGTCTDDVAAQDCVGEFALEGECAVDFPNCGNPGACCNPYEGTCEDDVLALDCPADYRHEAGEECEELEPICGTPGACCIDETATCTIEFEANCEGRFLAGAVCDPDPWEALGQASCGNWTCGGILYAPSYDDDSTFRANLAAISGDVVDYLDPRSATPTLADIQDYCIVFTWVNNAYADSVAFGDLLADYVDAGGTVILGQWTYNTGQYNWLEGRIMTEAYCPVTATSVAADSYVDGSGTDCIFAGVNSISGDAFDQCDVVAGAVSDGLLSGGKLAAAWRADKKVYYIPGGAAPAVTSGDMANLIAYIRICATGGTGACCDPDTGVCEDDVDIADCSGQFALGGTCAADFPHCGEYECPVQPANAANGLFSDPSCDFCDDGVQWVAENFEVTGAGDIEIDAIGFWGGYYPDDIASDPDVFTVIIRANVEPTVPGDPAVPGDAIVTFGPMAATTKAATGATLFGVSEYGYTIDLEPNVTLSNGTYWIEIINDTADTTDSWFWETGDMDPDAGVAGSVWNTASADGPWNFDSATDLSMEIICVSGEIMPKADPKLDRRRDSRRSRTETPATESFLELGTSPRR